MTDREKIDKLSTLIMAFADTQQHTREQKDEALKQVRELQYLSSKRAEAINEFLNLLPEMWGDNVKYGKVAMDVPADVINGLFNAVGREF